MVQGVRYGEKIAGERTKETEIERETAGTVCRKKCPICDSQQFQRA